MDALEKRVGELPHHIHEYDRSLRAIRSTDYKLIRGSDGSRELYHITEDPDEGHDIANDNPEIVNDLETELDDWLDSVDHTTPQRPVSISQSTKDRLEELGYLQ
jgi:arylsulfatase A-like enzyme